MAWYVHSLIVNYGPTERRWRTWPCLARCQIPSKGGGSGLVRASFSAGRSSWDQSCGQQRRGERSHGLLSPVAFTEPNRSLEACPRAPALATDGGVRET